MGRKNISREKIIHAFLVSCFDKSAGATSLSDVADLLGIKKASLYNHFESRETMYNATIKYCGEEISRVGFTTDKTFDSIKNNKILPINLFKKLITRFFELFETEPLLQMYSFLNSEKYYNDSVLEIVTRERNKMEEDIKKILDTFVEVKKFTKTDEKDIRQCAFNISTLILDRLQIYIMLRKSVVRKNPESGEGSLFSLPTDDIELSKTIKNIEFIIKETLE